ncbi:MAG: Hsp20 family protein [Rhodospirillales bacterium]|nr:Hsp20 family protein [Rhodospirillales bacterium]
MRTFDFSPLFRTSVGFDNLQRRLDSALRYAQANDAYPPYNIEKLSDDGYRISIAVAGFGEKDLDVTVKEDVVVVSGKLDADRENAYLHRGIATRSFERRFQLADHVKVVDAHLADGLLEIDLAQEVPEELKPRRIKILSGPAPKAIEHGEKAA